MRSIKPLGLACCLTFGGTAFADNASQYADVLNATKVPNPWQADDASPGDDRLRYLNGELCLERLGCSAATPYSGQAAPRKFVDALDIGSYGPMDVKFTGNRVKLKVWF